MQTRPATPTVRSPTRTGPPGWSWDPDACRGTPSAYPSGTSPAPCRVRDVQVGVRDAGTLLYTLDVGQLGLDRHGRHEPEFLGAAELRHGRQAVDGDARPHEVVVGRRAGQRRRGVGQVAHLEPDARRPRRPRAPRRTPPPGASPSGASVRRPPRGATRGRRRRRRPRPRSRVTTGRSAARSAGVSPLRLSPVSTLSCTRAVRPTARAAAATSSSAQRRGDGQVDVGLDRVLQGRARARRARSGCAGRRSRRAAARAPRRPGRPPARSRRRRPPRWRRA